MENLPEKRVLSLRSRVYLTKRVQFARSQEAHFAVLLFTYDTVFHRENRVDGAVLLDAIYPRRAHFALAPIYQNRMPSRSP
jgi:hypothetical protein